MCVLSFLRLQVGPHQTSQAYSPLEAVSLLTNIHFAAAGGRVGSSCGLTILKLAHSLVGRWWVPPHSTQIGSDTAPIKPPSSVGRLLHNVAKMDLSFKTPQKLRPFASIMITAATSSQNYSKPAWSSGLQAQWAHGELVRNAGAQALPKQNIQNRNPHLMSKVRVTSHGGPRR